MRCPCSTMCNRLTSDEAIFPRNKYHFVTYILELFSNQIKIPVKDKLFKE